MYKYKTIENEMNSTVGKSKKMTTVPTHYIKEK